MRFFVWRRGRGKTVCARVSLSGAPDELRSTEVRPDASSGPSTSPLERMHAPTVIGLIALLTLSRSTASAPAASELPQGRWELKVCESFSYTGTRCANLDQRLRLRVNYPVGLNDDGKAQFDSAISKEVAQQIFERSLSVIQSFRPPPSDLVVLDGDRFTIRLKVGMDAAEVELYGRDGDFGAELEGLVALLREATHAF